MMPGMNQRQVEMMMKRMGVVQQEIDATQVIIKTPSKTIYIDNPQVSKINMMGQQTFQVVGEPREESLLVITEDDVATVAQQANVPAQQARKALERAKGDLATAILELKK